MYATFQIYRCVSCALTFTGCLKAYLLDIIPTDISWSPAGCGHDALLLHLRQAEITDHDLGVFIRAVVEQILWL